MNQWKRTLAMVAILLVAASALPADTRKANIDVIIALDKSLSMEDKIGAVKNWVNTFILDQLIIPGDNLIVIAFYGKADLLIDQTIRNAADRDAAKAAISRLRGDGHWTDIGNALDAVKAQLGTRENDGREKYVLLLTDGIQEAPPTSKYWSKNGAFNHEFLANTKTIQHKGWKVMILGIGIDTAAKQLAQELQGTYSEITKTLTPEAIATTTGSLFGMPSLQGPVTLAPVSQNGSSRLSFTLKSSGLTGDVSITLGDVSVQDGERTLSGLLTAPVTVSVTKDRDRAVSLPLRFPAGLAAGSSPATLTFTFTTTERFAPAQVPVTFRVLGWVQSYALLLVAALVLLLIIAALVVLLIWRLTSGKPVRFAVLVDDSPISPPVVALRSGRELFLNDIASRLSLVPRRNAKSVAKFRANRGTLGMSPLKADRFPKQTEFPAEVRGASFVLRTETGTKVTVTVQSKERKH